MKKHDRANERARRIESQIVVKTSPLPFEPAPAPLLRLLRFAAVRERTGLSRSTIWRLEQSGAFPKHRQISANAVAWVEDEVMNWIRSKVDPLSA